MDRIKRLSFEVMDEHKSKFNEDFVENIIKDGVSNAVFKTNNAKLCTLSLLSTLNGIYHWYSANGELNARDISHNILNLFFLGLKR